MQSTQNPRLWNLLVVLTIVVGGVVTLMILNQEPDAHATGEDHTIAHVAENDSTNHETTQDSRVVETDSQAPVLVVQQPEDPASADYSVVAGSFLSQERAQKFETSIREKLSNAQPLIVPVQVDTITWYRVIVLRSSSIEDINALKQSLQTSGYGEAWVYERRKVR